MTDDLKRDAPRDTGELARKTGVEVTSVTNERITSTAEIDVTHAEVVVHGSRPHVIRPRNKRALSFYWPKRGATVVLAKVNHPGTQANDFFDQVTSKWREYLQRSI